MKMIAILLAAALTAACADSEVGDPDAETPENLLMHDTLESAALEADTAEALTVVLNEFTVRLARDTIEADDGPTVLRARNNGTLPHILAVEGGGESWSTDDPIGPGEWGTLEADLQPGTYDVYCPIEGDRGVHREMGMTAPLVVR